MRSLIWVLGNAVLQTIAAFISALILMQAFRWQSAARIWIILSWIVPTVVVVIIWRWMLGTSGGIVNYLLVTLGITDGPIGFFSTAKTAFSSVVLINSWRWFPLMTVILLAGMKGIPKELYEAAAVDGANAWQRFISITVPTLAPILFVLGLVGTLWSVNVFDIIWLSTGGGPSKATTTLPVYIYEMAFKGYHLSQAAAASVLMDGSPRRRINNRLFNSGRITLNDIYETRTFPPLNWHFLVSFYFIIYCNRAVLLDLFFIHQEPTRDHLTQYHLFTAILHPAALSQAVSLV